MNVPQLKHADEREQSEIVGDSATMGESGESKIDGGESEISRGAAVKDRRRRRKERRKGKWHGRVRDDRSATVGFLFYFSILIYPFFNDLDLAKYCPQFLINIICHI
jgi:hypothetical protein